ncbi:hypothetical protein AGMMS49525_16160 [Bacteroidia bacterium]|nr:hypothetical protein AGMMS49525_16160 [Bacteroidia bacterium]
MKLYHGSYTEIDEVDLSKCETGKDFGQGFYVTKFKEQAETWAVRKGKKIRTEGVVTEFDFDEFFVDNDRIKFLHFNDYTDDWLDFVVLNRKNKTKKQVHDYDIIEGPVANDRIATQIDDYLNGNIAKEQFLNDLVRNPSHQMCFCTVQSLQALSLAKGKIDSAIYHIDSDILQSLMSDYGMSELDATDKYYTSKTYSQLVNETTELYKKPWQEIYEMLKQELIF